MSSGIQFRRANRTQKRLRVAVDGVSGSGKTFSLLRLAHAMRAAGLCRKIAVIDTENGGSESYANDVVDGHQWDFEVTCLDTYSIPTYIDALDAAHSSGFDCVLIDSLSHAWIGKDGALDMVDRGGGQFGAWRNVTPLHRRLLDAIIHSPCHVLASMRSKADYVVEKNEKGKNEPRKVGMAPVQREGVEYEFDLYGSIDLDHNIRITKSRCSAMQDSYCPKPDARFWAPLLTWMASAQPVEHKDAIKPQPPKPAPSVNTTETVCALFDEIAAIQGVESAPIMYRMFSAAGWDVSCLDDLTQEQIDRACKSALAKLDTLKPQKGTAAQ